MKRKKKSRQLDTSLRAGGKFNRTVKNFVIAGLQPDDLPVRKRSVWAALAEGVLYGGALVLHLKAHQDASSRSMLAGSLGVRFSACSCLMRKR